MNFRKTLAIVAHAAGGLVGNEAPAVECFDPGFPKYPGTNALDTGRHKLAVG